MVLIAQQLTRLYRGGIARRRSRPPNSSPAFLLASYDLEDWRLSAREDAVPDPPYRCVPSPLSEDGRRHHRRLSWSGRDWLRLTGEVIAMHSRRGEYVLAELDGPVRNDTQFQLDTRFFF